MSPAVSPGALSLAHWSYAAMLAFCLAGTLPLHVYYGLSVLRQARRLLLAMLPVACLFVAWDVTATSAGQWRFDPAQTLPPRVAGLPLEEYAFFLVIPLAGILTYEAVGVALRRHGDRLDRHTAPGDRHAALEDRQGEGTRSP